MTDEEYLIKLGQHIAELRQKAGYNQSQFALKCDMDKQNMSRLEKGRKDLQVSTLRKLARELGIEVKELLDFK